MTKIVVAVGCCTPARTKVLTLLEPYGFKGVQVTSYSQNHLGRGKDGAIEIKGEMVTANVAEIEVSSQAARWAEYLICRSKQFRLLSKPVDPRNQRWAAKWNTLPKAWRQAGCTTKRRAVFNPIGMLKHILG